MNRFILPFQKVKGNEKRFWDGHHILGLLRMRLQSSWSEPTAWTTERPSDLPTDRPTKQPTANERPSDRPSDRARPLALSPDSPQECTFLWDAGEPGTKCWLQLYLSSHLWFGSGLLIELSPWKTAAFEGCTWASKVQHKAQKTFFAAGFAEKM